MRSALEEILRLSKSRNCRTVLTTFALGYPPEDIRLQQAIMANESKMLHFWGRIESTVLGVRAHNGLMRELAKKHGVTLIDNTNLLPRDSAYFIDICHFTHLGVSKLAQHIAKGIVDSKMIDGLFESHSGLRNH